MFVFVIYAIVLCLIAWCLHVPREGPTRASFVAAIDTALRFAGIVALMSFLGARWPL